MDQTKFIEEAKKKLPKGTVLDNPRDGISTVVEYKGSILSYRRMNTKINVDLVDFWQTYDHFRGTVVTSPDLGKYKPSVFSESAHECNKTFFMMTMKKMGLTTQIDGSGKSGDPFKIQL